jgi:hypothetical protein
VKCEEECVFVSNFALLTSNFGIISLFHSHNSTAGTELSVGNGQLIVGLHMLSALMGVLSPLSLAQERKGAVGDIMMVLICFLDCKKRYLKSELILHI